jgi:hypothetical protein
MEHVNPLITDQILSFGNPDRLLLFLVAATFSPSTGFFRDIAVALSSLPKPAETIPLIQEFDSRILQPYIPHIANLISRVIIPVRNPLVLLQAIEM